MVIGMNRPVDPFSPSEDFIGPVGDHLVGIHVGRGPGAGLKDIDHKFLIPFPFHDLFGGLFHCPGHPPIEDSKPCIRPGRGILDKA